MLSIVIPTFNRPTELLQAAASIAEQLTGELLDKVEIIITDNASDAPTVTAIKDLAAAYPAISYLRHGRDEGGFFQFLAAPWRARGRWTWVFGADDILMPGGVAYVVGVLEREAPGFLTLNKRVFNATLSEQIRASNNAIPDRRFDTFTELFCAVGINQLAFITGNVELTEAARRIDPEPYLQADTRHPHVAAYLEKHHGAPACYASEPYVVHRVDNAHNLQYNSGNFFDYGVTFPTVLAAVAARIGAPKDLFERINGDKHIESYDRPEITFVDCMFENILRALYFGRRITVSQRRGLEAILASCAPHRLQQLSELWDLNQTLVGQERQIESSRAMIDSLQQGCLNASRGFARQ